MGRDQNVIEEFKANWNLLAFDKHTEFSYGERTLNSVFCATSNLPQHDLPFEGSEDNHAEFYCVMVNKDLRLKGLGSSTVDINQASSVANQAIRRFK